MTAKQIAILGFGFAVGMVVTSYGWALYVAAACR